jgi:hypothetical protein
MCKELPVVGLKYKWGTPQLTKLGIFVVTSVDESFLGGPQIFYTYFKDGYKASMPASFWFSDDAKPVQVH